MSQCFPKIMLAKVVPSLLRRADMANNGLIRTEGEFRKSDQGTEDFAGWYGSASVSGSIPRNAGFITSSSSRCCVYVAFGTVLEGSGNMAIGSCAS